MGEERSIWYLQKEKETEEKIMPGGLKKKSLRTELDLTPKQKMFVEIYVADWGTITQAEALKRAGYVCTNEKDYGSVASRMLSRKHSPHIANYFDRLFEREVKKYTSDNLRRYKRLERIADKAEKEKQFAAAINAEYRSGQLAGAYVDRKEVTVSGLEGMSREQLEKKLEELSKKIDGHNAKTIQIESEDVTTIEKG